MDLIARLLAGLNVLAVKLGTWLLGAVGLLLPVSLPPELAVPVGWLTLLTAGLVLGEVARKLTWVLVGVGWLLIAIRIVLVVVTPS